MSFRAAVSTASSLQGLGPVRLFTRCGGSGRERSHIAKPGGYAAIADKSKDFVIGSSKVLPFYDAMSAGDVAHPDAAAWFVEADRASVTARERKRGRSRINDERMKSARVAIVSSLFLVLLGAALLLGGHAAIDPLLKSAMEARQAKGIGEVLYAMPDGIFCRHISFDNATAQIAEGGLQRCAGDGGERSRQSNGFAWHIR
jgi:hypothetical protein